MNMEMKTIQEKLTIYYRKPTPWADQGFGSTGETISVRPTVPASFGVYVEDNLEEDIELEPKLDSSLPRTGGLQQRKKTEKPAMDQDGVLVDNAKLSKNPLYNFDKGLPTVKSTHKVPEEPSPIQPENNQNALRNADEEDMTINTKLALDDMFDMFASPSMAAKKAKGKLPIGSKFGKPEQHFQIFSNVEERTKEKSEEINRKQNKPGKPFAVLDENTTSSPTPSSKEQPFAVFNDTATTDLVIPTKKEPFSIFDDSATADSIIPTTNEPFSIFNDGATTDSKFSPKKEPFAIFDDSSTADSNIPTSRNKPFPVFSEEHYTENQDENEINVDPDQENINLPKKANHPWKVDSSRVFNVLSEDKSLAPIREEDIEDILNRKY
mmetsp:Transcript_8607/g.11250  ORF Transcript_8607/g.11250 Transcript_8607/m.11250 type:complete len:381 (-) Transcript_8607:138-1280(-)